MALEKRKLVLRPRARHVLGRSTDAEVVEDLPLVDGGGGLGYQLRAEHGLAVPLCGVVEGDFGALRGGLVGRVGERGVEVDVGRDGRGPVDVVLVGADLGGPGPFFEVG